LTARAAGVTLWSMSPKVSAVLELVSELSEEERKNLRLQLETDEGAAALGRKAPKLSPAILDELEWRFVHDTGPSVPVEVMMKRARQTLTSMRKKHQNPKKK
jgi:hypothetical protein